MALGRHSASNRLRGASLQFCDGEHIGGCHNHLDSAVMIHSTDGANDCIVATDAGCRPRQARTPPRPDRRIPSYGFWRTSVLKGANARCAADPSRIPHLPSAGIQSICAIDRLKWLGMSRFRDRPKLLNGASCRANATNQGNLIPRSGLL